MKTEELKKRIEVLSRGSKDKAVLVTVANQLKDEHWNPREILKAIKQETGVGLSLRTTFKKKKVSSLAVAKTAKVLERKTADEITKEATSRFQEALDTGKTVVDLFGPLAKHYGYESIIDYLLRIYDFWDTYHDYVPKMAEEKESLKETIRELVRKSSPEGKRVLLANKMSELMQNITALHMLGGKFPPPYWYFEIRDILASILYDEL